MGSETRFAWPLNQYLLAEALVLAAIHVNHIPRQLRECKPLTFRDGCVVFHDLHRLRQLPATTAATWTRATA